MRIQHWIERGTIGAAGGAAGAILAGAPIATGAAVGALAMTVGMVAMVAIYQFTRALDWLSWKVGEPSTFFGALIATNTAAAFVVSRVAGLGLCLVGSLFPVVGSVVAWSGVMIIQVMFDHSNLEKLRPL